MREITDFDREWVSENAGYKVSDQEVREFLTEMDREWVSEIAGYKVSDQEVREFMADMEAYEESLEISPEIFSGD